jgi:hypothetical protein
MQSFPFKSKIHPKLSEHVLQGTFLGPQFAPGSGSLDDTFVVRGRYGAYDPEHAVYTHDDASQSPYNKSVSRKSQQNTLYL